MPRVRPDCNFNQPGETILWQTKLNLLKQARPDPVVAVVAVDSGAVLAAAADAGVALAADLVADLARVKAARNT